MENVVAVYSLTNTASINIYEIDNSIDERVLVGINNEDPEWCIVYHSVEHDDVDEEETPYFVLGELTIPLGDCMRI